MRDKTGAPRAATSAHGPLQGESLFGSLKSVPRTPLEGQIPTAAAIATARTLVPP
jgi:hypothetical protein